MGRKKAATETPTTETPTNGFDAQRTPEYVGRIEELQSKIDDTPLGRAARKAEGEAAH